MHFHLLHIGNRNIQQIGDVLPVVIREPTVKAGGVPRAQAAQVEKQPALFRRSRGADDG